MSLALMTPYEPPKLARSKREFVRMAVLMILMAFILALLAYAILTYGPGFFLVGWYAWLAIVLFALVQLILYLQRNRFGVGQDWIAPPYKPLSRALGGRYNVHPDEIVSIRFLSEPQPSSQSSPKFAPYVETVITLKSGEVLRFPTHNSRRSLRRQVRTEREIEKALQAIVDFSREHGLLEEQA